MDSLKDLLLNKDFEVPDEVARIKNYVKANFNADVAVNVNNRDIIVSSRSAGLIASLRLNSPELIKAANSPKKIRFRIG